MSRFSAVDPLLGLYTSQTGTMLYRNLAIYCDDVIYSTIMDRWTRPTRKAQEVKDSTDHVTSLQVILLPLDNSEIFEDLRVDWTCRGNIVVFIPFKCRWTKNAAKLLLIRIPMVSFNVPVMLSKINLSYTSLGLPTSSRSPSLKLPSSMNDEMALQRRRTVDVQPAYGLSSWSRTTTAPLNWVPFVRITLKAAWKLKYTSFFMWLR